MGFKLIDFGVHMRKGVIFTIRGYRLVLKHPLLVCAMCVFIYMRRSHPFTFSLLLSASPVLVCTALLLGMLLLFGQQNIPETEKEKRERYKAIALKNGMLYSAIDEQNERCCVEGYSKSKRDDMEKVGVESGLLVNKLAEIRVRGSIDGGGSGGGGALCKDRRSVGNESESSETGELDETIQHKASEWNGDSKLVDGEGKMDDHYAIISKVIGELLESESEHEKSEEDDCSDFDREENDVDSPPHVSDSGSDGAESSSPEASIDERMPILDELHPLLDEQTAQMSRVGSEAELTEQSPPSSIVSDEETEVPGSESVDDDDDDEDDDVKKDQTKSVIKWTEEDQKNLMDVGSSEIERNQRLERILRRRKNMSMVPELDLIEFENPDIQLNIAPISTARRNPFDLPQDAFDSNIPGSAPSILLQRRNPFDLPYDEDEIEDESREVLRTPSQSKQPFLRRRDNFHARIFAPKGQDRQPARFRPFFIPEQLVSEESNYSSFQEQSSGVNSDHETESDSSVHQGVDHAPDIRSPRKNYSPSSSFSDGHPEFDPGLFSHGSVTDKQAHEGEVPSSSSNSSCNDHDEVQVPNAPVESLEKPRSIRKLTIPDFHELDHDIMSPCCSQVTRVNNAESTSPDHSEQGSVDSSP